MQNNKTTVSNHFFGFLIYGITSEIKSMLESIDIVCDNVVDEYQKVDKYKYLYTRSLNGSYFNYKDILEISLLAIEMNTTSELEISNQLLTKLIHCDPVTYQLGHGRMVTYEDEKLVDIEGVIFHACGSDLSREEIDKIVNYVDYCFQYNYHDREYVFIFNKELLHNNDLLINFVKDNYDSLKNPKTNAYIKKVLNCTFADVPLIWKYCEEYMENLDVKN